MSLTSGLVVAAVVVVVAVLGRRVATSGPERIEAVRVKRGLGPAQRWQVQRAVSRGRAVADPALAAAAVAQARCAGAHRRQVGGTSWLAAVVGLVQIGYGAERLAGAGFGLVGALQVVVGAGLLSIPWQHRYYGRRFDRAERANRALLTAPRESAQGSRRT